MKKLENSFAVSGFVGKDAVLNRHPWDASRYRSASLKRKARTPPTSPHSPTSKPGARTRTSASSRSSRRGTTLPYTATSSPNSGRTRATSSSGADWSWWPQNSTSLPSFSYFENHNFTLNKPTTHKLTERFSAQLGVIYKKTARLTGTGTGRAGHSKTGEQKCQGLDR